MINLERRGVIKNQFKAPFRRRKPWLVDWDQVETKNAFAHDKFEAD